MIFRQLFEPVSSTYTYLLGCADSGRAVLIDPVLPAWQRDLEELRRLGLTLAYTLDTHIHADHITAARKLREEVGSRIAHPAIDGLPCADLGVEEGVALQVGSVRIEPIFTPGHTELDHDFLWRTHVALPERGRIGIFNRSYYEEVLIVRVLPEILLGEKLPDDTLAAKDFWGDRYRSIADSEAHLHRNGTRIVKIFLHLSKDEQRDRLIARIDEEDKNWKFDEGDIEQRQHWDKYMAAYADCLAATSTADCPWYVVPADDKKNARLIVSQILVDTLAGLDLHYPETTAARREKLLEIRRQLESGEG